MAAGGYSGNKVAPYKPFSTAAVAANPISYNAATGSVSAPKVNKSLLTSSAYGLPTAKPFSAIPAPASAKTTANFNAAAAAGKRSYDQYVSDQNFYADVRAETWSAVKLWDNATIARNVTNLVDQGSGLVHAVYGGVGNAIADLVGVSGVEDARTGRDFYGNRLSTEERVLRGVTGGVQLVTTALGIKAGLAPAPSNNVPRTLEGLQTRIDTYASRAQLKAFDKGLSGVEAGNYADRYFSKAVNQLNSRLQKVGSDFRALSQHGLDTAGVPLGPNYRPNGSLFLDATLTSADEAVVYSGWDTRFQSTPYARWNTNAQNAAYVQRFQIQEGFVREISLEARRPH